MQDIRVQNVFIGSRESFEDMNRAIATHQIKPVVDKVFPWKDAREALRCVESGSHFGKVCMTVNP